jgi:hypothetical protein
VVELDHHQTEQRELEELAELEGLEELEIQVREQGKELAVILLELQQAHNSMEVVVEVRLMLVAEVLALKVMY